MTRGKYAARAANRLAQTDSELLLEKVAECEALQAELDAVRLELQHVKTTINSRILLESVRLAQDDVEAAKAETQAAQLADHELHLEVARECTDYVCFILDTWAEHVPNGKDHAIVPMWWIDDLIPRLVGQRASAELLAKLSEKVDVSTRREMRRRTPANLRALHERSDHAYEKRKENLNKKFAEKLSGASDAEEA